MKKKSVKVITALTIVCALIAITSALINYLLPLYLSYKFNLSMKNIKDAGSIGIIGSPDGPTTIIGSSDGPTAVFIAGQSHAYLIAIISAVLAILGAIYLAINKKFNKID